MEINLRADKLWEVKVGKAHYCRNMQQFYLKPCEEYSPQSFEAISPLVSTSSDYSTVHYF